VVGVEASSAGYSWEAKKRRYYFHGRKSAEWHMKKSKNKKDLSSVIE
jgi:hypothetical protein